VTSRDPGDKSALAGNKINGSITIHRIQFERMQPSKSPSNRPIKPWKKTSLQEKFQQRRAFVLCMLLAACLGVMSAIVGNTLLCPEIALMMLVGALLCDLLGVGILTHQMIQQKKNSLHLWALEEAEKQEIMNLRGNTPDELGRMLDYHLKTGNIKEADAISHRLLALVDVDPAILYGEIPAPNVLQLPTTNETVTDEAGLPEWLKNGDGKKKANAPGNLPQWMQ
jgi:hypothetical protein